MRVLIIEDEYFAAEKLKKMILDYDNQIIISNVITNIKDSIKYLQENTVDLIFLDIQLEDGISFKIFEHLEIKTPIIFTTAYDEFAIKAFELNSISYLLKPIKKEKLSNAIEKYLELKTSHLDFSKIQDLIGKKDYKKRFLINIGLKIKTVEANDIAYFFAHNKTVYLMTYSSNKYDIEYTIEKLDNILDPNTFFKINRKIIININSINSMYQLSRSRIKIELNPPLPENLDAIVSIDNSTSFKEWLNR